MNENGRAKRAAAIFEEMSGRPPEAAFKTVNQIAPDLARIVTEVAFGDFMTRPGLDRRQRELCVISALAALGHPGRQLRAHIAIALKVGCAPREIVEAIAQVMPYAGAPAALNGVIAAKEVFDAEGVSYAPEVIAEDEAR